MEQSWREWKKFADKLGRRLKTRCREECKNITGDAVSPQLLAFQEAIAVFPVPLRIIVIEDGTDGGRSVVTIIRHDLTRSNCNEVEFVGVHRKETLDPQVLCEKFGLELTEDSLSPATYFDAPWNFVTTVLTYQPLTALSTYADEFYRFLHDSFWDVIQAKFCKQDDYNAKYGLAPEPILEPADLLRYNQPLANVHTGLPPTIHEWQSMIADVLLIPKVPDAVQRTFKLAKQLFVFSYFVYGFSTASQHYAFLALEAALQARWSATLPEHTKLDFGNGTSSEIARPKHKDLYRHWKADRKLKVNGERFPNSTYDLLRSLRKKGIIKTWQMERIDSGIYLRNELSHLEEAPITGASVSSLAVTAELINAMFDSVP